MSEYEPNERALTLWIWWMAALPFVALTLAMWMCA